MNVKKEKAIAKANLLRFKKGSKKGHYESYFIRANHPNNKEAFWIRYTIFSAKNGKKTIGEVWAVYFNKEENKTYKEEFNLKHCNLNNDHFNIKIGQSKLNSTTAVGQIKDFSWKLNFKTDSKPIFLLPLSYYDFPLPKAKSIVSKPFARFSGEITIQNKKIRIDNWLGSQNHNWGEKHTDYYAWGQVAGFDNYPTSFLELITAQQKIGFINTPFLTLLVLHHNDKTYHLNTISQGLKAKGEFDFFNWTFTNQDDEVEISGQIKAYKKDFVALEYYNPPGGSKTCLNSKVAYCKLIIKDKKKQQTEELISQNSAAFEILTDRKDHGITVLKTT